MLALHKIINLVGGWTYKSKHDLDKDSDIITSNRSTRTSSNRSTRTSSNRSTRTSSNRLASSKIGYHKKPRGIKNNKSKRGRGRVKGNKTKSKR